MTEYIKARPTVYKGIKMRSRLEAGFAQWLDEYHMDWTYEPCAFAADAGQYLPDFRIDNVPCLWTGGAETVYVEVKPKWEPSYNKRMAVIWESEPRAVLLLEYPRDDDFLRTPAVVVPTSEGPGWDFASWGEVGPGLGLSLPLRTIFGPWPHEYWNVT